MRINILLKSEVPSNHGRKYENEAYCEDSGTTADKEVINGQYYGLKKSERGNGRV